jgi:hypothetical protein
MRNFGIVSPPGIELPNSYFVFKIITIVPGNAREISTGEICDLANGPVMHKVLFIQRLFEHIQK